VRKLTAGLQAVAKEVEREPERLRASEAEDVHSFVEAELRAKLGDLAGKLHTGRSRNDQVATDLKLFLRGALGELDAALADLMHALALRAAEWHALAMPGYTHLQRGQPITAGHHALAYVEMLARDRARLADAQARLDTCPLGSGALAGTAWPIDRVALARALGFRGGPTRNSLDAVADRDHVCEVLFGCALILVHLSRLAEDWIFFATQEAGFLTLADAVTTGSSLMPQKKNPDALELIRGKSGRVLGDLQRILVVLKGLPLAYNKDLQEDKEALFEGLDATLACLRVMRTAVVGAQFDVQRCRTAAGRGQLNATDLADLLVARGVPFRTAHERAGKVVRRALELGIEIEELPAGERRELLPELPDDLHAALGVDAVLARRMAVGGTAPARVRRAAADWLKQLASARSTKHGNADRKAPRNARRAATTGGARGSARTIAPSPTEARKR
jgi:argininosuccinate lyase